MLQRARVRARELLSPLSVAHYRRLWSADVISDLGDWAGRLALAVVVHQRTDSAAWAAAVTAVSLAGFVGIGQVLATLADRFGRITVMLVADVVRAACFLSMLLPLPVGGLLVLAFVAGLATPAFEAARAAAMPDLVPERLYGAAIAFSGLCVQVSLVAGYALGGGLLAVVDPEVALAVNASTFLVSAAILWTLRSTAAAAAPPAPRSVGASLRDGVTTLLEDVALRRSMAVLAVSSLLGIVPEALVVPYAAAVGFGQADTGLLAAAVPVGTIVATALVPTGGRPDVLLRGALACALVASALAAPLLWFEVGGPAAVATFAVSGAVFAVAIPTNVVLGTRLERRSRASAMGIVLGVVMGLQAVGAAVGGVVASRAGVGPVASVALALVALWSAVALVRWRPRGPRPVGAGEDRGDDGGSSRSTEGAGADPAAEREAPAAR